MSPRPKCFQREFERSPVSNRFSNPVLLRFPGRGGPPGGGSAAGSGTGGGAAWGTFRVAAAAAAARPRRQAGGVFAVFSSMFSSSFCGLQCSRPLTKGRADGCDRAATRVEVLFQVLFRC